MVENINYEIAIRFFMIFGAIYLFAQVSHGLCLVIKPLILKNFRLNYELSNN